MFNTITHQRVSSQPRRDFSSTRMAAAFKTGNTKRQWAAGAPGVLRRRHEGCGTAWPLGKAGGQFLRTLICIYLLCNILLLVVYSPLWKHTNRRLVLVFLNCLIYNRQKLKTVQIFIKWLGKPIAVYVFNRTGRSHSRRGGVSHSTPRMQLRDKHCVEQKKPDAK